MKKFESLGRSLSKNDQKQIRGGVAQSCTMTYQDSSGGWHTETGSCYTSITSYASGYDALGPIYTVVSTPFCHTASFSGPVPLSSNDGVSRCGAPSYS